MNTHIDVLINNKYSSFTLSTNNVFPDGLQFLSENKIDIEKTSCISITENIIIIVKSDLKFEPVTDKMALKLKNNIDAYDRQGKHIWNITDIIGPLKITFMGGRLWTSAKYQEFLDSDICKYSTKINHYTDGHLLYACNTDPKGYIIDLNENKVIWEYPCR